MITAQAQPSFAEFGASLAAKAKALAEAAAANRIAAHNGDPRRWRMARLLWPL